MSCLILADLSPAFRAEIEHDESMRLRRFLARDAISLAAAPPSRAKPPIRVGVAANSYSIPAVAVVDSFATETIA